MAIYSVGRRRVIIGLLLTSALLLTLDLRGNPVIDRARDAFGTVMGPVESATEVVTTPIERTWNAITEYDDLERENQALQDEIDRLIARRRRPRRASSSTRSCRRSSTCRHSRGSRPRWRRLSWTARVSSSAENAGSQAPSSSRRAPILVTRHRSSGYGANASRISRLVTCGP